VKQAVAAVRKDALAKAEKEAAEVIAQAKVRAQKEREYFLANAMTEAKQAASEESDRILQKAHQEAAEIVAAAKEKVRIQIEDSSRLMQEIQLKMQQVIGSASLEIKPAVQSTAQAIKPPANSKPISRETRRIPEPVPPPVVDASKDKPSSVEAENENSTMLVDEENQTYEGRLKIDIAPPTDRDQVISLEKEILKTSTIKVIDKGTAEDGSAWIELEVAKPTRLIDVLKDIPSVKDVVGAKSYIIVAMKARQLV